MLVGVDSLFRTAPRLLLVTLVLVLGAGGEGCSLLYPFDITASTGDAGVDAGPDATLPDAPRSDAPRSDAPRSDSDAAPLDSTGPLEHPSGCQADEVLCSGICQKGDDCTGCTAASLLCRATRACVKSCATCLTASDKLAPIECFACDSKQNDPIGTCEVNSASSFCLDGDYSTAHNGAKGEHCDCSDTLVKNCLSDHQVCVPAGSTDWCVTCGEAGLSTKGLACKGGGKCDPSQPFPRCL